jgi:predicted DNA-binding transcriptional regulator AlpA
MSDRLLTDRQVSEITGRARSTLQKDRLHGDGIPYVYVGRLVRYRLSDVERFIATLPTCRATSEPAWAK